MGRKFINIDWSTLKDMCKTACKKNQKLQLSDILDPLKTVLINKAFMGHSWENKVKY